MAEDRIITQEDLGTLYPKEIELIWLLRNRYQFGEITIEMRNGMPEFIVETIRRSKLGALSTPDSADMKKA